MRGRRPGRFPRDEINDRQRGLLVGVNQNPGLDSLTRCNAKALATDAGVVQACGVQPGHLIFLTEQHVAVRNLGDGLSGLRLGAGQHVSIFAAAENEATTALYAYYDAQIASGKLTDQQEQALMNDFDELLALREAKKENQKKQKSSMDKVVSLVEQRVQSATDQAFVEVIK